MENGVFFPNYFLGGNFNQICTALLLLPMKLHCVAKFQEYRLKDVTESWLAK